MTVFEVVVVTNRGGTSSEWSIARDRSHRGDCRRSELGRQCGAGGGRDTRGAARVGGIDQPHGLPDGRGGWFAPEPEDLDPGACDLRGRLAHLSRGNVAELT